MFWTDLYRFPRNTIRRLGRPTTALLALFMTSVVVSAVAVPSLVAPAPVYAACHSANQTCFMDTTKTAVADVYYYVPDPNPPHTLLTAVEPDSATSWTISATWSPTGPLNCVDSTENATLDVTWTGTNWSVSNFVGTTGINAASVCALAYCTSVSADHAYGYRLYVDVYDPHPASGKNLSHVTFTATTVPNGHEINLSPCTLGSATTPTAASFNNTDSGSFECAYNCTATGTTVNITYN